MPHWRNKTLLLKNWTLSEKRAPDADLEGEERVIAYNHTSGHSPRHTHTPTPVLWSTVPLTFTIAHLSLGCKGPPPTGLFCNCLALAAVWQLCSVLGIRMNRTPAGYRPKTLKHHNTSSSTYLCLLFQLISKWVPTLGGKEGITGHL
jgi:hypothetical protein